MWATCKAPKGSVVNVSGYQLTALKLLLAAGNDCNAMGCCASYCADAHNAHTMRCAVTHLPTLHMQAHL